MKPKVLVLGHFPPAAGGITTFLATVFRSNITQTYNLIPFNIGRPAKPNVINNAGYRALLNSGVGRMLLAIRLTLWRMVLFPLTLLRTRPAIVHIHTSPYLVFWETAYYVLVTRLFRRPSILQFHFSFPMFYEASSPWVRVAILWIIRQVTVFAVICSADKRYLAENIEARLPCVYLPNFIDVGDFQREVELVREGMGARQEVGVLFLGGSEAIRKGLHDLLHAIGHVDMTRVPLQFLLIAVPKDVVEHQLPADLLARCEIASWVSGADKARIFAQADIFVLPTYGEGMPIAILEAMAASLPVISTRVGGVPDLVADGESGYLLTPGDVQGLAQAIAHLATDAETRAAMGQRALEKGWRQYDSAVATQPLDALYADVLNPVRSFPVNGNLPTPTEGPMG